MENYLEKLTYNEQGLIPAIIQNIKTKEVLMLAYMNRESIMKTIETKTTWFYSRSRQKLWNKGETSGNIQMVEKISLDCDSDTLLIEVNPLGNSCHTGEESCFYTTIFENKNIDQAKEGPLYELYSRILNRRENPKEGSYTNYLFEKGLDKILKKIGEEASEIIIAAKNNNRQEIISETSDFIYHLLVLMVEKKITIEDILNELDNRKK